MILRCLIVKGRFLSVGRLVLEISAILTIFQLVGDVLYDRINGLWERLGSLVALFTLGAARKKLFVAV